MSALGCIIVSIICFCNGHWAYGLGALAIIGAGIVAGRIGEDSAAQANAETDSSGPVALENGWTEIDERTQVDSEAFSTEKTDLPMGEGVIEKAGILYKKCGQDSVCVVGVKDRQDLLELMIPSCLGDWPVLEIEEGAFQDCTNVRTATIPQGVKVIAQGTFSNCVSLRSVLIPEGVVRIDREAFANCTSLRSVTIPDGVVVVDYAAFEGCSNLYDVRIPGVPPEHVFESFACLPVGASVVGLHKYERHFNFHKYSYFESKKLKEQYGEYGKLGDLWVDRGEKDGRLVWCRI